MIGSNFSLAHNQRLHYHDALVIPPHILERCAHLYVGRRSPTVLLLIPFTFLDRVYLI